MSSTKTWTNVEDEVLKAAVSKYGLAQWSRVASLLSRKSAKACKSRWQEWLSPSIKKTQWTRQEDESLLHLAKILPGQWRTIAPRIERTPQQCLQRYSDLLSEAETRERSELGLQGVQEDGQPPTSDDVRRLRNEEDDAVESRPAIPDSVDMDEDTLEMLSEARARLANTQGKKAKRKARERALEESRRVALLQKRRELKQAGINTRINHRQKGQMDYNADIPFERKAAPGFFDTREEEADNEQAKDAFDPRRQQLANKRKQDDKDQGQDDQSHKRRKGDKKGSDISAEAARAAQMQKLRDAERQSKRRGLNLPAPQVGESELESIVKMGMAGQGAGEDSLSGRSSQGVVIDATPIRTPRVQKEDDRVANEVRNARLQTETQSALLGGENPEVEEIAAPARDVSATPNPLATPVGQNSAYRGFGTERGARISATPTPRASQSSGLASKLASLPKPKTASFELEIDMPEDQAETGAASQAKLEDAAVRDARHAALRAEQARKEHLRQTQVIQRGLPRPAFVDTQKMLDGTSDVADPAEQAVLREAVLLVANDARKFGPPNSLANSAAVPQLERFTDKELADARAEIVLESSMIPNRDEKIRALVEAKESAHEGDFVSRIVDSATEADLEAHFDGVEEGMTNMALEANSVEKKLTKTLAGYQARSKTLRGKTSEAYEAQEKGTIELEVKLGAQVREDAAIDERLERLRKEVQVVMTRERTAQEEYRALREEMQALQAE